MATDPDCVDISRAPAPDASGPHFAMGDLVRESSRRAHSHNLDDAMQPFPCCYDCLGYAEKLP